MKKILFYALMLTSAFANAQIYPLVDGFEAYTDYAVLGNQSGYNSDMTVEPAHGTNQSKGLAAKMDNATSVATTVTPLVGPLTSSSLFTLQYRVVGLNSYPSIPVSLSAGDKIEIFAQGTQSPTWHLLKLIDETNHVASSSFEEIKLPMSVGAGNSVSFKIVVTKPSSNGFYADFDVLAVEDGSPSNVFIDVKPTITNPTCFGETNGTISLTINGGTPPYTYIWYPALPNSDVQTGLGAGTYYVTVADSNDNTANETITLTQPESIVLMTTPVNLICPGADHGSIDLAVQNANGVVSFVWSNSAQTEDISNLTANTYSVTATDALNCSAVTSQTITEPAAFVVTENHSNVSAPGNSDASILVSVSGGTPSYTYSINGSSFGTSNEFTDLAGGCHTVSVKDSRNCMYSLSDICVDAVVVLGLDDVSSTQVQVYPNPATNFVEIRVSEVTGAEISIINALGEIVRTKTQTLVTERLDVSDLAQGTYVLNVNSKKESIRKTISIVR